ncbi:MAG: hypothetical protein ACRENS_06420 [Candidatus Eiseniibacteriota bacterium]
MTKRWSSACASLCLALLPASASPGVIRGVLHVPPPVRGSSTPGVYAAGSSMPGMHEMVTGLASDAVVYVDHVPPAAESALASPPAPHPTLAQKGQAFEPRVLAVAVGTAVDFPNLDPIYHNVFSLSPARKFDLGKYPRGKFKTVVFDRTGLINVYCDIHSNMEAFVRVLPNHGFARPAADGSFALPELPAGRYQLHVWHPDLPETTQPVDVPASGDVRVEVSL